MTDANASAPPKTPRKSRSPVLWIVAGPNGSGKSSLYNLTDIEGWGGSVWIINPDLLTQTIVEKEAVSLDAANLAAVQRIQLWLDSSIETYQTIGVETVLSSPKYRNLVQQAKARGFRVHMIYVCLRSAELQAKRIAIRVSEGGHDVPLDKVVSRRARSFSELAWFARHVDECFVFDNSVGEPDLIAHLADGSLVQHGDLPPDLEATLRIEGVPLVDAR